MCVRWLRCETAKTVWHKCSGMQKSYCVPLSQHLQQWYTSCRLGWPLHCARWDAPSFEGLVGSFVGIAVAAFVKWLWHWWVGMAVLLRDYPHPGGLGGVLPWMNEDKAVKLYRVHSYREYKRKISKTCSLLCTKEWVLLSFCFPERKLTLAAVYKMTFRVHPATCEQQSGHTEWQVGLWLLGRAALCSTGLSGMCLLQDSDCEEYFCSFLPKNRWPLKIQLYP